MSKKSTKPKTYNPQPIDADGDGVVQEGTEFERLADVDLEFSEEELAEALASEEVQVFLGTHTMQEGENIQTIAALYRPAGKTRQEYAKELFAKNGTIFPGKIVKL